MRHIFKFLVLLLPGFILAQDLHFSQFFASPLTFNAANTGRFKEDLRFSAIHRDQWTSLASSFITTAISADINIEGTFLNKDKIGVGVLVFKDDLGEGRITNQALYLSSAYHRVLDLHKRHHLSGGAQFGFVQRSLLTTELRFLSQYQDFIYDESLSNNEDLSNANVSYLDLNAGVKYAFTLSSRSELRAGFSLFQLLAPEATFLGGASEKGEVGRRYVANAGLRQYVGAHMSIEPQIYYSNQSRGQNLLLGSLASYDLGTKNIIRLIGGVFYRNQDAMIMMLGTRIKNYQFMMSYDANTSGLSSIRNAEEGISSSGPVGAWEISLNVFGVFNRPVPSEITIPCGIF